MIKKYGTDNPFKLKSIQDKIKNTNLEKYGFESSILNSEIKKKSKETMIKKYGVDHYSKSEFFKSNLKFRIFDLYKMNFNLIGYELLFKKGNLNTIIHTVCGSTFEIQSQLIRKKINTGSEICSVCNPHTPSYKEIEIIHFIESLGVDVVNKYRDKYEIDAYIPELNLGFEFNGLYWHSELYKDKNYHIDKTIHFKEKGIKITHIWEDDWIYKQDIIKSMIINKLGKTPNKIGARKCEIVEVDDKEAKLFLNCNHLQGWCVSKYRIALKLNGDIISLATFGKNRINLGHKPVENNYELLRFCNKINWNCVGSFSKLLKFFIKNFNPDEINTYSDISISSGDLYLKYGFKFMGNTLPNYHYIIEGCRKNRFLFTKHKLIDQGYSELKTEREIMFENGHYRIYDCGSMKFNLILNFNT